MFGLEIIAAGMMYLAPTPVLSQIECHAKITPRINVRPKKSRIKYDFTKSKAYLNNLNVDTISPYGSHHKTNVSGLMSSTINPKSTVFFHFRDLSSYGQRLRFSKIHRCDHSHGSSYLCGKRIPEGQLYA